MKKLPVSLPSWCRVIPGGLSAPNEKLNRSGHSGLIHISLVEDYQSKPILIVAVDHGGGMFDTLPFSFPRGAGPDLLEALRQVVGDGGLSPAQGIGVVRLRPDPEAV